jgi:hypothetical protein
MPDNRTRQSAIVRLEARRLLSVEAIGPEFRVNTFTFATQFAPAIGMDADGDFVITWRSNTQDGSGYGVYAQRYNAAGLPQGDEFRVNTHTTSHQRASAIAMDPDGNFVIAWHSSGQDGSFYGIYAQRYNAAAVAQGGEFRVNSHTTSTQAFPFIGIDADGDIVVAWQSLSQDDSGYGIYAQRYNSEGVAQGDEFQVNTFTTGEQRFHAIAMDPDGDFVIAWQSQHQDGSSWGVYAQRYKSAGVAQGEEFRVNTFTTSAQGFPAIGMAADGDFVITWDGDAQDGDGAGIFAQRYNPASVAQGTEFRVNTYTTSAQFGPAIGMDAHGNFVVAWDSNDQDASGWGIYAQRYVIVPTVSTSDFLFDTAPHRLRFVFDENVFASLGSNDVVLQNLTTDQIIPSSDLSLTYDLPTNTATFSYTGNASGISGVLPDGNYRATLQASGITDPAGTAMPANYVFEFHVLAGDADHDADVDVNDLGILATNWQQSPRSFSQGDFDYSGTVEVNDLGILASRWQEVLTPPGAPTAARSARAVARVAADVLS